MKKLLKNLKIENWYKDATADEIELEEKLKNLKWTSLDPGKMKPFYERG